MSTALVGAAPPCAQPLPPDVTVRYTQGDASLTVRRGYCKACGLCVDACPRHILLMDEVDRICVTDISACIFCGICAGRCPDFVFVLDRGERSEPGEGG